MTLIKRLVLVAVLAGLTSHASKAEAAWGDLLCGISNGSAAAFKQAVDLYNESEESERQCKTAIVFNAKQKLSINQRVIIEQTPPDGLTYGFAIRKCIPSGPYADPFSCPELANDDVELDFTGVGEDNGDCPILVKAGAKIDFRRVKLIVKNANKAVCTFTNKTNIAKDSDNNPNNNASNSLDDYAWIANDVTITGAGGTLPQAPTCEIASSSSSGGGFDITWTSSGATSVSVKAGSSEISTQANGSQHVTPSTTTTYTIIASNAAGECTDSVKVTPTPVVTAPTCQITASDLGGGDHKLEWQTTNATTVTLDDGTATTDVAATGEQTVHPAATTVYTLHAANAAGSCEDTVVVTVSTVPPAPTCGLTSTASGDGYDLTWTSTNGTTASLSDGSTTLSTDLNSAAPLHVAPAASTTYTLTITGAGGVCSRAVTLTPAGSTPTAPTCDLTAVVAGDGFDLTWISTNGTTASLSDGSTTLSTDLNSAAPLHVAPAAPLTYTLTVTNAGGTCSKAILLTPGGAVPTAPTCTLNAAAASGGFDLTWTSTNGTTASLSDGATTLSTDLNSAAPLHVTPVSSTTYTLTVTGAGGSCSRAVTLAPGSVGPAPTCTLNAAAASGGFDLTWTSSNGTTATLSDGASNLSTALNSAAAVHVTPSASTTYTLTVNGAGGQVCSRAVTLAPGVPVGAAPTCTLNAATSAGGGFDLTWTTSNATTVSLKEGSTSLATDANSSSAVHVNPSAATAYTLEATGSGGNCKWITTLGPTSSGSGSPGGGTDTDGDGIPDDIETNTFGTDPNNPDTDGDGLNDGAEVQSPFFPACGPTDPDCDDDGVCDGPNTVKDAADNVICAPVTEGQGDNCPLVSNGPNTAEMAPEDFQKDSDGNGVGDVCEGDMDGDTVQDDIDNCSFIPNEKQEDEDANGIGDACDPGFSFSPGGGGGCGCRIEGPTTSKSQASLAFLTLGLPLLLLRSLRKRKDL